MAEALDCHQTKVSRVERGVTRITPQDVRTWAQLTGANSDVAKELVNLAKQAEVQMSEYLDYRPAWARNQRTYAELEETAVSIKGYQQSCVPGLVQSMNYARYLLGSVIKLDESDLDGAVAARLERQSLLLQPDRQIELVIAEQVLLQKLGGAAVMYEQLKHLAVLGRLPQLELSVLPVETEMPETYGTSFFVYETSDADDSMVVIELETREVRESASRDLRAYRDLFDVYKQYSLNGDAALERINDIADRRRSEAFPSAS